MGWARQTAGHGPAPRDNTPARLPRFPRQLLIHCLAPVPGLRELVHQMPGMQRCAERALLLASADDVVCLSHSVPTTYLHYLKSLGLGPTPPYIVTVPAAGTQRQADPLVVRLLQQSQCLRRVADLLRDDREVWLNCYVSSDADVLLQCRLATALHKPVHIVNSHPGRQVRLHDKRYVRQKAVALGLPVPPGEAASLLPCDRQRPAGRLTLQQAIDKYGSLTGRAIVRGIHSVYGSSLFVVAAGDESQRRPLHEACRARPDAVFLVEPFYDVAVSTSVSMFIDPRTREISCLLISDQLRDDRLRYLGHRYPTAAQLADQMVAAAVKYCVWLRDKRITGHVSFDFCEYREPGSGQPQLFLAGLKPHVTGAMYPLYLLERLNTHSAAAPAESPWTAFRTMIMPTPVTSFAALQAAYGDLLLDRKRAAGLIPANVGLLKHGYLMVAILGRAIEDVEAIYERFCQVSAEIESRQRGAQSTGQAA